jgi:hypothetical protein
VINTLLLALLLWCPAPRVHRDSDAILLARIAVSEAGWSRASEHTAIWSVLERRADSRGLSLASMARSYCRRALAGSVRKPWLSQLNHNGDAPSSWNVQVPWSAYRERWLAVLRHAQMFVRGERNDLCEGAMHWSDRSVAMRTRALANGLEQVECESETVNAFWR